MFPSAFISVNLRQIGFGFASEFSSKPGARSQKLVITVGHATKMVSATYAATTLPLFLKEIRGVAALTPSLDFRLRSATNIEFNRLENPSESDSETNISLISNDLFRNSESNPIFAWWLYPGYNRPGLRIPIPDTHPIPIPIPANCMWLNEVKRKVSEYWNLTLYRPLP